MDLLTAWLSLVDRLISLIQARKLRRKDYFEKIIDPLYIQFIPLGEDILTLFRTIRLKVFYVELNYFDPETTEIVPRYQLWNSVMMGKASGELHDAISEDVEDLIMRREKFLDSRNRLRALLEVCERDLEDRGDEQLQAFVRSMFEFFNPRGEKGDSDGARLVSLFSSSLNEYGFLQLYEPSRYRYVHDEIDLAGMIESMTRRLESSWYEIAGRYMELKLKNTVD